jgi:hypothetical protein
MQDVSENIPSGLQPRVEAALAWFNASADAQKQIFKVTGIIDPDEALAGSDELRLILCGGDRCEQRSFRVSRAIDSWAVEPLEKPAEEGDKKPIAKLDPPPGAHYSWIDRALSQHSFVVLLFYRGFW